MLYLGINSTGIKIVEMRGNIRTVLLDYPWVNTEKISFNKRRFSILPKTDVKIGQKQLAKTSYSTSSYRKWVVFSEEIEAIRAVAHVKANQHCFPSEVLSRVTICLVLCLQFFYVSRWRHVVDLTTGNFADDSEDNMYSDMPKPNLNKSFLLPES